MKKLLIFLVLLVSIGIYAVSGYCWNCPPKACRFDVECGVMCWCYKGEYQIKGVCVSE